MLNNLHEIVKKISYDKPEWNMDIQIPRRETNGGESWDSQKNRDIKISVGMDTAQWIG